MVRITCWGIVWLLLLWTAAGLQAQQASPEAAADPPPAAVAEGNEAPPPTSTATSTAAAEATAEQPNVARPMICLAVGVGTVLGLIIFLRLNAFIALITAAMLVSVLAPGPWGLKISRVAEAFGATAGGIGIVIALAAVIGTCLLDSGAADRIVRAFVRVLGQKHAPVALMGSGFVLAVPVFFDTVFYLLVPLARSLHRKTGVHYLKYILAIGAGGAITHTLVPPTPGPLVMAMTLGVEVGLMIMIGALVAFPAALAGLFFADVADRIMPIPMRQIGAKPERPPLDDDQLPSLLMSLLPVLLPVVLISTNTVMETLAKREARAELVAAGVERPTDQQLSAAIANPESLESEQAGRLARIVNYTQLFGNANLALLLSTVIAMVMLIKQQKMDLIEMAAVVETSLMSGGVIILITAGGGAFGAMLKVADVGTAIQSLFSGASGSGMMLLGLGFSIAVVLKIAQGSSTVAMITGSAMLAGIAAPETLGFHPVYLATAIGGGSLVGSWMNDSGFWIFAKMGGLTEVEALKTWTTMLVVLGLVSFGMSLLLAHFLPLV